MIYAYKCRECGARKDSEVRGDRLPDEFVHTFVNANGDLQACRGSFTRDYSGLQFASVMQAAYNPAVGKEISSNRKFDDDMKRASEARSLETGMEHRFERVDPSDKKALGVTDEGIDQSNRVRAKQGLPTFKV